METIYIILTGTLISGLFCFSFFFGFALGLKQGKATKEKDAVEVNENNVEAYKKVLEWLNFTGQ